ncbi:hypothetical protein U1Q18_012001 [Sarracenia purpurea var. burkii]
MAVIEALRKTPCGCDCCRVGAEVPWSLSSSGWSFPSHLLPSSDRSLPGRSTPSSGSADGRLSGTRSSPRADLVADRGRQASLVPVHTSRSFCQAAFFWAAFAEPRKTDRLG